MKKLRKLSVLVLLAAGFALAFSGCSNTKDESGTEQGGDKDDQNKIGSVTQDLQSYRFVRHRFMNADETIDSSYDADYKLAWSNARFNEAYPYMKQQLINLKNKIDKEPAGNFLATAFYDEFLDNTASYFPATEIDIDLNSTYTSIHYVLGTIGGKFATAAQKNNLYPDAYPYQIADNFTAHYGVLALRAYQDSLGSQLNNTSTFTFSGEQNTINNTLEQQATKLGNYAYSASSAQDTNAVEDKLYSMLELVARETGVSVDTLQAVVDMSLLTNSLWGARDLGARSGIQLTSEDQLYNRPNFNMFLTSEEYSHIMSGAAAYQMDLDQTAQAQQDQGYSR